ncbi:hypothetical protein ANCCAN_25857 [Ancylostoma caninum]|uniref:Cytochrome b-c1 complex subunit Rieske transmembrane domain-containing protein n=1 Tax=Ancylostoma caninum TaxID=29170 RepID=A0A368FBL1_ANCCA|nr:hypothetical protein ANCCAN_25857 [Ancylostoma caninum]
MVQAMVYFKGMPADQVALATIEVDTNEIPEGQTRTFEWRGKPVFVKHRTKNEIARYKRNYRKLSLSAFTLLY